MFAKEKKKIGKETGRVWGVRLGGQSSGECPVGEEERKAGRWWPEVRCVHEAQCGEVQPVHQAGLTWRG